ncbi:MAG: glycosyltransferase [Bacteroidetes bacterium]|nr:glycosyltransferase [Bacteroidota bacterium]
MRILQLYHKVPFPPHDGGSCALLAMSQSLIKAGVELTILAMNTTRAPGDLKHAPPGFLDHTDFRFVEVDNRIRLQKLLKNQFTTTSSFAGRFDSPDYRQTLVDLLHEKKFDFIQAEHLYLGTYFQDIRKNSTSKICFRPQNVETDIWKNFAHHCRNPLKKLFFDSESKKLEKLEPFLASQVDGIMAISEPDAEYFRKSCPGIPVTTVPYGLNLNQWPDLSEEVTGALQICHLGSMDWRPNIEGLRWFIKEVLPIIRRTLPQVKLHLGGRNIPSWFNKYHNDQICVHGEVDNIFDFYRDKALVVVPLLSGSGMRVKIVEAMAMGKTVVSTPLGAQGILCENGRDIMIAGNAESFAEKTLALFDAPAWRREMGKNARRKIFENHDLNKLAERVLKFYNEC